MYYYFYAPIPGAMCKIIALLLGLIIRIFEEILHSPTFPKMKLYYSPSFTGECYRNLPVNETCFEKVVGDAGLLDFLELRLGLAGATPECSAIDRILAYMKALDRVKAGAFYIDAFENDDLATAKEILRWRDLLVMEGFNANTEYKSPRLQKLAEVEKQLSGFPEGVPERWKRVHELADGKLSGVDIEVCHDFQLLPKLIRETLEGIGVNAGRYDRISVKKEDGGSAPEWNPTGKSITIHYFDTVADAYGWAANERKDFDGAVICPDPFRMNAVLRNRELPLLEASASGDSSITQLLRLGLSLLERPLNINNLLEYLRTSFSPIPGEYRYPLAAALKRDGGRGEEWKKKLAECEENEDVQRFLLSLLDADVENGTISSSIVTKWCEDLAKWSPTVITEDRKAYQLELVSLCDEICRVINNMAAETIMVNDLMRNLKTLYEPAPIKSAKAMAKSWNAIGNHRCLIDPPQQLLWLPCNGGLETPYPYSFLLQEEKDELSLKSKTDFIRFDFNLMELLLGQTKTIELCVCDFDRAEALSEHPAVTRFKSAAQEEDHHLSGDSAPSIFETLHTLIIESDQDGEKKGLNLYPADVDYSLSATSTETLIAFPFDFVMEKKLGFQDVSSLSLSDITPTQGNVAHYVFQKMMDDSSGSIKKMKDMLETCSFEKRVKAAAEKRGAILLLKENGTLFSHFIETIQNSIKVLLDILEISHLTPKECEYPLNDVELDFSKIKGSVDFYAETTSGDIVLIDFKYSKGRDYIEKLEEDKSIQLETYAKSLETVLGRTVVAKGYYFFPINQLHSDDRSIFKENGTTIICHDRKDSKVSLYDRITASTNYRKTQLINGTLEIEEGYPLQNIQYHMDSVNGSEMIDIPAAKKKRKSDLDVKASSPFVTPTKFPILKNSIK